MECSALLNDLKTSPKLPRKTATPPDAEAALRFIELFKKAVKSKKSPS